MSLTHRVSARLRRCAVAGTTALLIGAAAHAQSAVPASDRPAVIVGRVLDQAEHPLADATVRFEDFEFDTRTAADGTFALSIDFVPDGIVAFRRVGFAPARVTVRLARGDTLHLVAHLARVDLLDTVRTVGAAAPTVRLAAFEARRASGRGVFVTREEIERRNSITTLDVIRASGAVRIIDSLGVLLAASTRGGRWNQQRRSFDPNCVMRVAVDGIVMPQGFSLRELPSPAEVAGIEIFKGPASLPAELSGARPDAYCGLVAVWTR